MVREAGKGEGEGMVEGMSGVGEGGGEETRGGRGSKSKGTRSVGDTGPSKKYTLAVSCSQEFHDVDIVRGVLKHCGEHSKQFIIREAKSRITTRKPNPPFITSSLQQTAQNSLGFNVKKTMGIAQKLYENGKITYMRTDCTFISKEFSQTLNEFITDKFGSQYYNTPKVKKVKGAQEAHEAIRPTNINTKLNDNYDPDDIKLYHLIVKRTAQSHMKPAIIKVNSINLINSNTNEIGYFISKQKEIKFDGYMAYNETSDEDSNKIFHPTYIFDWLCGIC